MLFYSWMKQQKEKNNDQVVSKPQLSDQELLFESE